MKTYSKPISEAVNFHTEMLATSFGVSGEVDGPVGSQERKEGWTDWDKEISEEDTSEGYW